jgi:hypothetical protein
MSTLKSFNWSIRHLTCNAHSGSYMWPDSTAPLYIPGFAVTTVLMFGVVVTSFALMILTKKYPYESANARHEAVGAETDSQEHDLSSKSVN